MQISLAIMGVSMIYRTGDLRGKKHMYMTYIGQVTNGVGLALLTTTTFPEVVDSIEKRSDYVDYDKDEMHLHISSVFVFISALA